MTAATFIRACFSGLALIIASVVSCWMPVRIGEFLRGETC